MERGSDKHSAMLDEALKHDNESLRRGSPREARPGELAAHARQRHAPDKIVALLERAPDHVYETVSELWTAVGGRVETPRTRG